MIIIFPLLAKAVVAATDVPPPTVQDWVQAQAFNGVIAIQQGEDRGAVWTWGLADRETGRELTPTTRFQTGSIDKYFASIAVFALIDEGVLALDEPISTYLPEYRAETGARLTLRTILSNQSGLPNDLRIAFRRISNGERDAVDAHSVAEAVAEYASGDLAFEPGAQFDYALSNWLLVQHLLAEVTGLSYPQVRETYVYDRAGMADSGGYVYDLTVTVPEVADVAIGFDPEDPEGQGDYWSPRFFKGSYTTAYDLLALERALQAGAVLSDAALRDLRTIQAPEQDYAYGGRFDQIELCGRPWLASRQSGSNGASNITAVYVPGLDAGVTMLTNVDENQGQMFSLAYRLLAEWGVCPHNE